VRVWARIGGDREVASHCGLATEDRKGSALKSLRSAQGGGGKVPIVVSGEKLKGKGHGGKNVSRKNKVRLLAGWRAGSERGKAPCWGGEKEEVENLFLCDWKKG